MFDELKLLSGEPIPINDFITINQPNLRDIKDFGEQAFFNTFYSLCSIPSDMKSVLWDLNIDYCTMSDWDLFMNTCRGSSVEDTKLVFGDLDFSNTLPMTLSKENEEPENVLLFGKYVSSDYQLAEGEECIQLEDKLFIPDKDKIMKEQDYATFIPYVREMFGYVAKPEKAGNKITKMALIDEDRRKRKRAAKDNKPYESNLTNMIISLVNTEEFSYNYQTVMDVTMYQLMKSYMQIQKKKAACAIFQGSMSGFVDTSKMDKDTTQWIYTKPKTI